MEIETVTKEYADIDELLDDISQGYHLVLHNDDHNTFDWVIECLMDICGHTPEQAEQCSLIVHFKGRCKVKGGSFKKLKPLKDALIDRGLNATIDD